MATVRADAADPGRDVDGQLEVTGAEQALGRPGAIGHQAGDRHDAVDRVELGAVVDRERQQVLDQGLEALGVA